MLTLMCLRLNEFYRLEEKRQVLCDHILKLSCLVLKIIENSIVKPFLRLHYFGSFESRIYCQKKKLLMVQKKNVLENSSYRHAITNTYNNINKTLKIKKKTIHLSNIFWRRVQSLGIFYLIQNTRKTLTAIRKGKTNILTRLYLSLSDMR